jgi:signal transduction histidine kinase
LDCLKDFWKDGPDGFCLFDKSLNCIVINRSALRAPGRKKAIALGLPLRDLFPVLDEHHASKIRDVLKTGKPTVLLGVPFPINGGRFARVAAFKVRAGLGLILSDMTEIHLRETELNNALAQAKNLARHDNLRREDERRRIARKIHDEMAPLLTMFKMDLYWLLKRLKDELVPIQPINDKIAKMERLIDETIVSVQDLCSELRPALLEDLGLQAAMEWHIQELRKHTPLECRMNIDGKGVSLGPDLSVCLFLIFQEGLANILRHAEATKAEVSLRHLRPKNAIELKIRDNGKGIKPEEASNPKSFGLIGIRERLSTFNGRLKINGNPGRGTTLTVSIPLASRPS